MSFGGFKFGSSSSAPSSAQPPSVPSFSLTGATPQPTPSTSTATAAQPFSFGQPASATTSGAATTGGGMFGAQNQQQQSNAGGGLFGGSLFSGNASQPQTSTASAGAGGGLFGSTQQQQQQPQQGGLFGQSTTQAPQPGLFGQSTSQPSQPGLFGQSTSQPQQQSSLFSKPAQPQSSGLFGQSTNQPQQQSSLFGQSTNAAQASSLSNSTAGQSSGINKSTKFTDLPENVQKTIEQMDSWIKQQKQASSGMNVEALGRALWQTSGDVKAANEECSALSQGQAAIQNSLLQLRAKFVAEEEDLRKIAEIWETFKSIDGRPGAVRVAAHRDFPFEFFSRVASGLEDRVGRYKKTISQLHRAVQSLSKDQDTPSPQAIAQTIQNHQDALIALAAQLEGLQMKMNDLRLHFAQEYRERTSSMRDPFEVAREEKGLPPVRA